MNRIVAYQFHFLCIHTIFDRHDRKSLTTTPFLGGRMANGEWRMSLFPLFQPVLISVADVAIEETGDQEGRF
jgi:hypothetical protein